MAASGIGLPVLPDGLIGTGLPPGQVFATLTLLVAHGLEEPLGLLAAHGLALRRLVGLVAFRGLTAFGVRLIGLL
jgi:hypothetical protein